jgi:hypothetical protein
MSSSKHTTRLRTLFLSFIIFISVCGVLGWGIRELLFPPTDVCAIERNEGQNLLDISQVYPLKNNIELIGHVGGEAKSVFVRGDTAFVKLGLELAAFDVRDPDDLRRIGYILIPGELVYVDEKGHSAYIHSSGLWKVDVSNPAKMSAAHVYNTKYSITSIKLLDEQAYITTRKCEYMYFFEGSIKTRCDDTFHVVDTNKPDYPVKCYQELLDNAVRIFTTSDAPELITAPKTARQGNYNYGAEGKDGLRVYDVSNPIQSVEISSYSSTSEFIDVIVYKTQALATSAEYEDVNQSTRYALHAFDFEDSTDPKDLGELPHRPIIVTEFDHYAVLRDQFINDNWPSGVEIFDMSPPILEGAIFAPTQISEIVDMSVIDKRAYATTNDNRFLILDMSNIENPLILASYSLGRPDQLGYGVSVVGNYAYILVRDIGMRILDISDESNVIEVGVYRMENTPVALTVKDHYAYMSQSGKLEIVDISNPLFPIQISIYDAGFKINDLHILNNYLFMTTGPSGLQVIDISDPTSPYLVGSFITDTFVTGLDVDCPYIYVSDIENGLFVLTSDLISVENCN